jgi:hypothetical protein
VWAEIVVVRPVSALDDWRGRDAEWQLGQDRGLEDALRAQERHALALEDKALGEERPRQSVAMEGGLLREEGEGVTASAAPSSLGTR